MYITSLLHILAKQVFVGVSLEKDVDTADGKKDSVSIAGGERGRGEISRIQWRKLWTN
jgi:hypothetical protein